MEDLSQYKENYEYPKLDPAFKIKWLQALRSGEYKQTTGSLCRFVYTSDVAYCCLGIAGKVAEISDKTMVRYGTLGAFYNKEEGKKLPSILNEIPDNNVVSARLIQLNDSQDRDFNWIANWIEVNL